MSETEKEYQRIEFDKWFIKSKRCPARIDNLWCTYKCSITQKDCYVETCFAKYWEHET